MYLLDTNVVSEFRKKDRANPGVQAFFADARPDDLYLGVQVIGEIQAGIEKLRLAGSTTKVALYQGWLQDGLLAHTPSASCRSTWMPRACGARLALA